jgi:DNA-binding CsgD family transcriptional regulator
MQSWAKHTGRPIVKNVRLFPRVVHQEKNRESKQSSSFVFCERATGVAQFRAQSASDLDLSIERIAGLLAMQCLVRGQNPGDFEIMVPAQDSLVRRLISRAQDLLEKGRAVACPSSLSPRQTEILHSVLRNRANKEIASELNITVRTVKFHVSSLLSKFGVENRMELARRAVGVLRPTILRDEAEISGPSPENSRGQVLHTVAVDAPIAIASKARSVRFPAGRVLTA